MTTRNYEAMFILDNNAATADFEATAGQVDAILEKHGANIVVKEKWDDRKLAYEIKGRRRGTYYLTYFQSEPDSIDKIDEDVHLTENILRHMVIVLDHPIEKHIEVCNNERELLAEDSRKNSLGGWGDRRRGGGGGGGGGSRGAPAPRAESSDAPAAPSDAPAAPSAAPAAPSAAPAAPGAAPAAPSAAPAAPSAAPTEPSAEKPAEASATQTDAPSNDAPSNDGA